MSKENPEQKLAVVYGMLPSIEEVDQLEMLTEHYDVTVVSSESIVGFFTQNIFFEKLQCIALPDHDENTTFLPGLEKALKDFELVLVKERLGIYAFQVVKAKWKYQFRFLVWIDNLTMFPGDDVQRMSIIRNEVTAAADGFIVQTKAAKKVLRAEGIHEEKIHRWNPYAEKRIERTPPEKREALKTLGMGERDCLIVFTGQVEWEEGLLDLIHAIKIVKEENSFLSHALRLAVCGIGSFATEIKQRAVSLGVDTDVVYLAPNRKTFKILMQAADMIYVGGYPSRDRVDGDGFRLISAMTYGIPVLAPRTPLTEEILDKHRLDYCLGSSNSLAKAILKTHSSKQIVHNIVQKNTQKITNEYNHKRVQSQMLDTLSSIQKSPKNKEQTATVNQIIEVEEKIFQGQYLAAVDLIESIFELQKDIPNHHKSNLYRLIGDCFTKLGDTNAGKNAYVEAAELDPYSAKAHIGLGTVSLTKANYDIGVIHFQKAVSLAPNDEMASLGLGLSFHGLDELVEASKWVMKSLEINPENTAAIYSLVRIAQEKEQFEECEHVLRKYLSLHPHDHNMLYTLGGILYKLQKYDDVLDSLREIIAINPMDARAQSLIKQARRAMEKQAQSSAG